jgi:hypothetical protein
VTGAIIAEKITSGLHIDRSQDPQFERPIAGA